MDEFWKFTHEHWIVVSIIVYLTIEVMARLISRLYRVIMVCSRGWPPAHLDADGDWEPEE